ncbi:MAG TPA: type II secretion system protein [Micromonosporaceae bacterium]|jgi:prepilin-type N-terminal cleavage/methylation domain-containing protein
MRTQRGFTLIELLISIVVLSIVTASLFKLVTTSQQVSRAQSERTTLQSNIRSAAIVIPTELREINAGGSNDILSALTNPATTIQYRAMRGASLVCATPPNTNNELTIYASKPLWTGLRKPVGTRDAAFVFRDINTDLSTDDVWLNAQITGVTDVTCTDGSAGYRLTISPAVADLSTVGVGAPVRTYEVMEMGLYLTGGEYWLGARSVSNGEATMQPIVGPLTSDGLAFTFLDGAGAQTTNASLVKSIQVTLKGLTDQAIVVGRNTKTAYVRDSLTAQVVLRNALR